MNLLIVCPGVINPVSNGSRACINSYAKMLIDHGYTVKIICIYPSWATTEEELSASKLAWGSAISLIPYTRLERLKIALFTKLFFRIFKFLPKSTFSSLRLLRVINNACKRDNIQAIIANYWVLADTLPDFPNCKKIIYTHDVFADRFKHTGSNWFSTSKSTEAKALSQMDCILAIQEIEAEYFRSIVNIPVFASYVYTPIQHLGDGSSSNNLLYFAGKNQLNIQGIRWYIEHVWRQQFEANRDLRLIIGGGICTELSDLHTVAGLQILGAIDSPASFYSLGDISINPCFSGTGLKIKSIEALSYGRALVSSSHAIEGLPNLDHCPIILANTPEEYIAAIASLIDSKKFLASVQNDGANYVGQLNNLSIKAFQNAIR